MTVQITFDRFGRAQIDATTKEQLESLMHRVFATADKNEMEIFGAEQIIVVKTVADYNEYGRWLLTPREIGFADSIKLIKKRYDVQAFQTSVDGRPYITRAGYLTDMFSFSRYDTAFEVHWDDAALAPYDIVAEKVQEAGEALARKRDAAVASIVATAAASVAGHFPTEATYLTKDSIDSILKSAASNGTPIRRVVVNAGTILDMSTAGFGTWPFPNIHPDDARDLLRVGYLGDYGNAQWIANHNVATDKVYFAADPTNVGVTVAKGPMGNAQDINIYNHTNIYTYWEHRGNNVFNPYNLWELTIT